MAFWASDDVDTVIHAICEVDVDSAAHIKHGGGSFGFTSIGVASGIVRTMVCLDLDDSTSRRVAGCG